VLASGKYHKLIDSIFFMPLASFGHSAGKRIQETLTATKKKNGVNAGQFRWSKWKLAWPTFIPLIYMATTIAWYIGQKAAHIEYL
jgi:hypothetical protein